MDRGPALFFLVFSLFVCQQSVGMGLGTFSQPGSGFLSFSAGAVNGVLAFGFSSNPRFRKGAEERLAAVKAVKEDFPK